VRPLPQNKTHGIVHSVKVSKAQADEIAKILHIPDNMKKWLESGEVHLVREAKESELNKNKA